MVFKMDHYKVKVGLRVKIIGILKNANSMGIAKEHCSIRKPNEEGAIEAKAGADNRWWIRHNDNTLGIYLSDEFNPKKGCFYRIEYFWREEGTNFLKVGKIISPNSETLEKEVRELTKNEHCSISAVQGPFNTEEDALN